MNRILFCATMLLLSLSCFASDVAVPGESIFAVIENALHSIAAQSVVIGMIVEFVLRLFPSKKPLGIVQLVGALCRRVGEILVSLGSLIDKVLPQNVKKS